MQLESLRKHFSQLEAKMQASDEVHRASQREAEVLKGTVTVFTNPPNPQKSHFQLFFVNF